MLSSAKLVLLSSVLLAGCASHQVTQQAVAPKPVAPFEAIQVQVNFATPAHSDYLSSQLIKQLAKYGVEATPSPSQDQAKQVPGSGSGLLQLTLTGSWTETFISHRVKPRRSLTQMRGRIERESPRFRSDVLLQDLHTGETVWQSEITTAGQWYFDFNDMARSLASRLTRQLHNKGLIAPASTPAGS